MITLYYILILILAISLIMGYKGTWWLWTFIFGVAIYMFSFSVGNPDYPAYKFFYETISAGKVSYINGDASSAFFSYINLLFNKLGFDFNQFRLSLIFSIFLTFFILFRNKIEMGVFLVCYAPVLFFFEMVQIRFFLAVFFCLLALYNLLFERKIVFLLLMLCGIYFHSMVIVCFALVLLPRNRIISKKTMKICFVIVLLLFSLLSFSSSLIPFLQKIIGNVAMMNEYNRYLDVSVHNGYLLYVGYQLIGLLLAFYTNNMVLKQKCIPLWNFRLNSINFNVQVLGVFFIIFMMINPNFSRYFRMFYVLNVINFSSLVFLENNLCTTCSIHDFFKCARNRNRYMNIFLLFLLIVTWWIGESFINHSYVTIINSISL